MEQSALENLGQELTAFFNVFFKGFAWLEQPVRRNGQERLVRSALFVLEKAESLPARQLAHMLDITMPHLSMLAEKMEESGFVERRHDQADRRVVHFALTTAGRQEIRLWRDTVLERMRTALSQSPDADIVAMADGMNNAVKLFTLFAAGWNCGAEHKNT